MLLIFNPAINQVIGKVPGQIGGAPSLELFLTNFITLAFGISGLIILFMLLWGGFEYMTAGGDKEATQKASKRISNAIVGLVLVVSIFAIIYLIEQIFGVSLINITIPTIS